MLRRIVFKILATADRGDRISEFATKLDHNEIYLSRVVSETADRRDNYHDTVN